MSTAYNVTEDRRDWARTKVNLMPPGDRRLLMEELMRRDERYAASIIGDIVSAQHGHRLTARGRVLYP